MPGLLDITDDPNTAGLLSLGLRLMSTPGKFGTALGQAGLGAMGDLQQARQMMEQRKLREQQAKMQGLQMQSLEQQLADAQRAREEAAALKQTRGSFLDSIDPTAGPAMPPTLVGALRAGFSPQEAQTFLPPKPEAFTLKPGERRYEGDKVVAEIPAEPPKGTRLAELIRERDALPPGHPLRATYDNAIRKETTHQPATQVSYGVPVAGVDDKGNPVFFQPDKTGGAPAIVPGVKPPPQKIGEKQQNQVAGIDAMGQAVDAYVDALKGWKKTDAINPNRRAEIGTFYNNMMLQAKEAYNLGVLNGPDYAILQDVVRDPLSIMGAVTSNEAMAKQATDLKRIMNKIKAGITKSNVNEPAASTVGAPKFLGFEPQ